MSRPALYTPCPAPTTSTTAHRISITTQYDDTTTDIDFTRALPTSLHTSKPRRSSMFPSKMAKKGQVTIFEDLVEDEELLVGDKQIKGKTLLSKPARKPVANMNSLPLVAATIADSNGGGQALSRANELGKPSARQPLGRGGFGNVGCDETENGGANGTKIGDGLKKETRRRTIFVPREDTTMLTIHPGANTENSLEDTWQHAEYVQEMEEKDVAANAPQDVQKPVRVPRRSLAMAPRRLPLAQRGEGDNEAIETFDVCGDNTGKENVPPMVGKVMKQVASIATNIGPLPQAAPRSRLTQPTAASQARQTLVPRNSVPLASRTQRAPLSKSANSTSQHGGQRRRLTVIPDRVSQAKSSDNTSTEAERRQKLRDYMALKRVEIQTAKLTLFPKLPESNDHPELYEENWLGQQETALTEVINEIFAAAPDRRDSSHPTLGSLRKAFIDIYHQPEVSLMHRRVQASLLFGAMSKPKTATESREISRDIGLRKRFMTTLLDTYGEDVLRVAAETIVGRELPSSSSAQVLSPDGTTGPLTLDPHAGRRRLSLFLDSFLASPIDIDASEIQDGTSIETLRWRKTALRSLMLVWLLDHAKSSGAVKGCLFNPKAVYKSSAAMLREIAGILLPTVGDIVRTLKQLDYEVVHVQDPLDEVIYRIENIAVDLRDGALLTHLVELSLDLSLSKHLKMPALGHAQKTFNVGIALDALQNHSTLGANVVGAITAEDIVAGHREKTLALLEALIGNFK